MGAQGREARAETSTYQNTLGVALYRAGLFAEAARVLERNVSRNSDDLGYDWVFLAMCKKRLGQDAQARAALAHAREWRTTATRISPTQFTEFQAFMREAESLLDGPLADLFPPTSSLPGNLLGRDSMASRKSPFSKNFDSPVTNPGSIAKESIEAVASRVAQASAIPPKYQTGSEIRPSSQRKGNCNVPRCSTVGIGKVIAPWSVRVRPRFGLVAHRSCDAGQRCGLRCSKIASSWRRSRSIRRPTTRLRVRLCRCARRSRCRTGRWRSRRSAPRSRRR